MDSFFKYLFRLMLLLLVMTPIVYIVKELALHPKSASFSGVVVDQSTGTPMAHARVIVNVNEWKLNPILDTTVESFGITADQEGRFSFKRLVDIRIEYISIEACAPNNHYGFIHLNYPYTRKKPVQVRVIADPRVAGKPSYSYDSFTGGYGRYDLQFLGRPWSTSR